jgi:methionyl-tRNA formyltransferase
MTYIVLSEKSWNKDLINILSEKFYNVNWMYINNYENFNIESLKRINPEKIFIPHWSHIIPEEIFMNFECIVFHMTDLPFGRGGSPLQNLIVAGIEKTKISALKVVKELDAGPIYLKKNLNLYGTAEEIFLRASTIIELMIEEILENELQPIEQIGNITHFKRRKPSDSNINNLKEINTIYDYIRMLDAEGYPKAFIENENFKFEFSRASLKANGEINADIKIIKK